MKLSMITSKWIGLRVSKIGDVGKFLKKTFWRNNPADINNRNTFDFIIPSGSKGLNEFKDVFNTLGKLGCQAVAFEFTDLQWKHNASLTDKQWQSRILIG